MKEIYHFILGIEIDFDRQRMDESAEAFVKGAQLAKKSMAYAVSGYDDDPRELWEVPEVMRYLREWYRLVKAKGGGGLDRLDDQCKAILLLALGKARIVKTKSGTSFECFGVL